MKNYDTMLDFGGSVYYLNVDKFTELIKMDHPNGNEIVESVTKEIKDEKGKTMTSEVVTTRRERDMYIQQTMYELLREMIDIVLNETDEMDEELGSLELNSEVVKAKYLLLRRSGEPKASDLYEIKSNGPKVYSAKHLEKLKEYQKHYYEKTKYGNKTNINDVYNLVLKRDNPQLKKNDMVIKCYFD